MQEFPANALHLLIWGLRPQTPYALACGDPCAPRRARGSFAALTRIVLPHPTRIASLARRQPRPSIVPLVPKTDPPVAQMNAQVLSSLGLKLQRHWEKYLPRSLPLTAAELNFDFDVEHVLRYGLLPQVRTDPDFARDTLDAYVSNYLREEIQQEALVRRLDTFARFLQVAALMNGQVSNIAGVARDAAVAHPTVQGYFETLIDTLIERF